MVRYVVVVVHGARGLRKGVTVGAQHPFAHIGLGDAGHATWPNVTDGANPDFHDTMIEFTIDDDKSLDGNRRVNVHLGHLYEDTLTTEVLGSTWLPVLRFRNYPVEAEFFKLYYDKAEAGEICLSLSVNARSEAERRAAAAEVAKQAAEEAAAALRAEEALMDADEVTTLWAEVHAVKGLTPPAGSKAREYSVAVRVLGHSAQAPPQLGLTAAEWGRVVLKFPVGDDLDEESQVSIVVSAKDTAPAASAATTDGDDAAPAAEDGGADADAAAATPADGEDAAPAEEGDDDAGAAGTAGAGAGAGADDSPPADAAASDEPIVIGSATTNVQFFLDQFADHAFPLMSPDGTPAGNVVLSGRVNDPAKRKAAKEAAKVASTSAAADGDGAAPSAAAAGAGGGAGAGAGAGSAADAAAAKPPLPPVRRHFPLAGAAAGAGAVGAAGVVNARTWKGSFTERMDHIKPEEGLWDWSKRILTTLKRDSIDTLDEFTNFVAPMADKVEGAAEHVRVFSKDKGITDAAVNAGGRVKGAAERAGVIKAGTAVAGGVVVAGQAIGSAATSAATAVSGAAANSGISEYAETALDETAKAVNIAADKVGWAIGSALVYIGRSMGGKGN